MKVVKHLQWKLFQNSKRLLVFLNEAEISCIPPLLIKDKLINALYELVKRFKEFVIK